MTPDIDELRVIFRDPFDCDHTAVAAYEGPLGICYGCGIASWKAHEDIKERAHQNELRRIREIAELKVRSKREDMP